MERGGDFLVVPSCRELSKNNAHDLSCWLACKSLPLMYDNAVNHFLWEICSSGQKIGYEENKIPHPDIDRQIEISISKTILTEEPDKGNKLTSYQLKLSARHANR
jgi:hypothetical protein